VNCDNSGCPLVADRGDGTLLVVGTLVAKDGPEVAAVSGSVAEYESAVRVPRQVVLDWLASR
jgi:hypothetical protein